MKFMVIGDVGLAELAPSLRKAEVRLGREVNVTSYSRGEFHKKVSQGDHFLTTVLKGSLQFVKGEQRDLDAITRKQPSSATQNLEKGAGQTAGRHPSRSG